MHTATTIGKNVARIITLIVCFALLPGSILSAQASHDQHGMSIIKMYCASMTCVQDASCKYHCVSTVPETDVVIVLLPVTPSIAVMPEDVEYVKNRLTLWTPLPKIQYTHSRKKQLLSVMKRE